MKIMKTAIIIFPGSNCDNEMERFLLSIFDTAPTRVWHKEEKLPDADLYVLPGGFSYGDYIRSGMLASMSPLMQDLKVAVDNDKRVLGVCNGFQILVELGLLPAFGKTMSPRPEAVLATNASDRFECRPALLKQENSVSCVFTKKITKESIVLAPCAHAEGQFLFPKDKEKQLLKQLIDNDQIVFRYVDENGNYAGYPWNPNGARHNIAGICNEAGNVFGMMPHPERVFYRYTHPTWMRNEIDEEKNWTGDGRAVFESVIEYTAGKF